MRELAATVSSAGRDRRARARRAAPRRDDGVQAPRRKLARVAEAGRSLIDRVDRQGPHPGRRPAGNGRALRARRRRARPAARPRAPGAAAARGRRRRPPPGRPTTPLRPRRRVSGRPTPALLPFHRPSLFLFRVFICSSYTHCIEISTEAPLLDPAARRGTVSPPIPRPQCYTCAPGSPFSM